jgi:hypothetical protein
MYRARDAIFGRSFFIFFIVHSFRGAGFVTRSRGVAGKDEVSPGVFGGPDRRSSFIVRRAGVIICKVLGEHSGTAGDPDLTRIGERSETEASVVGDEGLSPGHESTLRRW